MKLHDLRPAKGSRTERTRVGRGIAAGKGKTAGRGTKGQKSRSGASIPAWFEGGQTPLQMRVPKLRGFKNLLRIDYQVVNVGRIAEYAEQGRFSEAEAALREAGLAEAAGTSAGKAGKDAPLTVNPDLLRAVGLVSSARTPVKILGAGDVGRRLFVVADAFTRSAREKIEAAGGSAVVLEVPDRPRPALGVAEAPAEAVEEPAAAVEAPATEAEEPAAAAEASVASEAPAAPERKVARSSRPKAAKAGATETTDQAPETAPEAPAEGDAAAPPRARGRKQPEPESEG